MELLLKFKTLAESYPGFPHHLRESLGNLGEIGRVALLVVLILGVANCFFGYKLMKVWLAFVGVLTGAGLGYGLSIYFLESRGLSLAIAAVGAVLFGAAAFWIYQAGVFLFGLCAGTLGGSFLFRPTTSLGFFLCMLLGAAIGFAGVKFVKPIIIFLTSLAGGMSVGVSAVYLENLGGMPLGIALGAGTTVLGVVIQTHTTRDEEEEEEEQPEQTEATQSEEEETSKRRNHEQGNKNKRHADSGKKPDRL